MGPFDLLFFVSNYFPPIPSLFTFLCLLQLSYRFLKYFRADKNKASSQDGARFGISKDLFQCLRSV